MATTFRSGPRDPVTGRSSAQISSGNIVRDPNTGQPAQIGVTRQEEAAQRAAPVAQSIPSGALNFQDFLSSTGRSESDPYGSSKGFVGSALGKLGTLDYRNNLSSGIISALNQQAYDKYLNPQRDGQIRSFRPGDLAFIDGRTQQAVRAPSTAEGIMRFMPTTRMLQGLFNPSVEFEPVGQGPATRGSRRPPSALGPTSALQPGEAAPSGFILTSAQPRDNRSLLDVEGFIENLPRTGIGRFFDPVQKKFKAGPGIFGLEFDSNKRQVGVNYKIPISSQFVPDGGVTTPDGMNPFKDILQTPVINPDIQSNMPIVSGQNIDEFRNRPLPGQERPMTPKMRQRMRFKKEFPFGI